MAKAHMDKGVPREKACWDETTKGQMGRGYLRGVRRPPTTNMKSETAADLIISDKNFQEIVNYGYGLWRGEKRKRREEKGEGSV